MSEVALVDSRPTQPDSLVYAVRSRAAVLSGLPNY